MKTKSFRIVLVLIFAMLGTIGRAVAEPPTVEKAGTAVTVKGEVKATTPPETVAHSLKSEDPVFRGDKIETGNDGQLQVLLLDKTVFTLGPLSAITVDEFTYNPSNDDGKVKASMLKGVFRVISGKVAHKNSENMVVDFPVGSMGFRGTDVVGIINGDQTKVILLGPVGTGRIYVTNLVDGKVVTVDIDEAGFATIVDGPNKAPTTIYQATREELGRLAESLGLASFEVEGYSPPDIPDPLSLDTNVQNEENTRDISPTNQ